MIVLIDNYDSFTFNLVQYLGELGADVEVFRNDAIDVAGIRARREDHAVRPLRADPLDRDLVVAEHLELRAELAEVLDEVERERIVVVDDEDAGRRPRSEGIGR